MCMRSFHATVEAGSGESLCLSDELVDAINFFFCENCQKKQHQCFSCGELGSSDKVSGAEVFPCVSATCGLFYHPHCVAKLLHCKSAAKAEGLRKKIAAGEFFTCPIHKCIVCKLGENKLDPDLQFANVVPSRTTENACRGRLLLKIWRMRASYKGLGSEHEVDDEIRTPIRNHIKFPDDRQNKKRQALELLLSKRKVLLKERTLASTDASRKRTLGKV